MQQKSQYTLPFSNEEQATAEIALLNFKGNATVIDMGQESQVCGEKLV